MGAEVSATVAPGSPKMNLRQTVWVGSFAEVGTTREQAWALAKEDSQAYRALGKFSNIMST